MERKCDEARTPKASVRVGGQTWKGIELNKSRRSKLNKGVIMEEKYFTNEFAVRNENKERTFADLLNQEIEAMKYFASKNAVSMFDMVKNCEHEEKQITEMASDMDYGCTKRDLYPDDAKEIAKALYLLGYRKLDKDSIVLSREEYEKLQETITDLKYDKFDLKNKISEKDNKIALLEESIDCIKFNVDSTRKETAKEFAESIVRELWDVGIDNNGKQFKCGDLTSKDVWRIAKKFGVEVEE